MLFAASAEALSAASDSSHDPILINRHLYFDRLWKTSRKFSRITCKICRNFIKMTTHHTAGLSPDLMSSAERLDEIGRILAVGIARARQAKAKPSNINDIREVSLDFGAPQRGHVLTKRRRGEKT
jgi:hypothetical protein